MQPGDVAQQVIEALTGHAGGGVHVDAVEPLHDLGVVGNVKIRGFGFAEPLHLHVAAVVGADGHGLVDDLGDHQQELVHGGLGVGLFLLQMRHALGVGLHRGVVGVDLRLDSGLLRLVRALLQLAEQGAVGLGQLVALGLQRLALVDGGAALRVQRDDLVHQRQLGVLEFFADVLLHDLRVLPDKLDIKHVAYLLYCIGWLFCRALRLARIFP